MPTESHPPDVDMRLAHARELMHEALQLLDALSCFQTAAILDHAPHSLSEFENAAGKFATGSPPISH